MLLLSMALSLRCYLELILMILFIAGVVLVILLKILLLLELLLIYPRESNASLSDI